MKMISSMASFPTVSPGVQRRRHIRLREELRKEVFRFVHEISFQRPINETDRIYLVSHIQSVNRGESIK